MYKCLIGANNQNSITSDYYKIKSIALKYITAFQVNPSISTLKTMWLKPLWHKLLHIRVTHQCNIFFHKTFLWISRIYMECERRRKKSGTKFTFNFPSPYLLYFHNLRCTENIFRNEKVWITAAKWISGKHFWSRVIFILWVTLICHIYRRHHFEFTLCDRKMQGRVLF